MKQNILFCALFSLLFFGISHQGRSATEPPRIKRSDGFFGLHFDFHAKETDTDIGKNTTRPMIENIIDQVHPDFLQIDCKGHPGFSSYPTKVGNPAPGIVADSLKLWRQVTAERGVSLVMHYSGVIDAKAVKDHPDWSVVNASGKPAGRATSLYGPYVDSLMIPQLKELALNYGVDGAWVDGDCWGVNPDFSPAALAAFTKATGFTEIPHGPQDPHWFEFLEVQREAFRAYLRHYITEVKKVAPGFEIASNWAFSDYMPEPVSAPVDFLSGDVVPADSITSARISSRYLAGQGKHWDLMSWGFDHPGGDKTLTAQKPVSNLEREAAIIMAMGGGYQIYLKQERDGSIKQDLTGIAEIAKFCRARQAFCHHAQQVPQVALLLSTAAHYREAKRPFNKQDEVFQDALKTMLMEKYSVEILSENKLSGRMKDYPLILIPDWSYLEPSFKSELLAYVRDGGQLLLVGPKVAGMFQSELDVKIEEDTSTPVPAESPNPTAPSKDPRLKITLGPKAGVIDIPIKSSEPGASVAQLGKGRIAAIYDRKPVHPLLAGVAHRLFPEPMVEAKGGRLDVVINRINGKLAVNFINLNDSPEGPTEITIRQPVAPSKVTLQPANVSLPFKYEEGKITTTVPKLELHDIVMVE